MSIARSPRACAYVERARHGEVRRDAASGCDRSRSHGRSGLDPAAGHQRHGVRLRPPTRATGSAPPRSCRSRRASRIVGLAARSHRLTPLRIGPVAADGQPRRAQPPSSRLAVLAPVLPRASAVKPAASVWILECELAFPRPQAPRSSPGAALLGEEAHQRAAHRNDQVLRGAALGATTSSAIDGVNPPACRCANHSSIGRAPPALDRRGGNAVEQPPRGGAAAQGESLGASQAEARVVDHVGGEHGVHVAGSADRLLAIDQSRVMRALSSVCGYSQTRSRVARAIRSGAAEELERARPRVLLTIRPAVVQGASSSNADSSATRTSKVPAIDGACDRNSLSRSAPIDRSTTLRQGLARRWTQPAPDALEQCPVVPECGSRGAGWASGSQSSRAAFPAAVAEDHRQRMPRRAGILDRRDEAVERLPRRSARPKTKLPLPVAGSQTDELERGSPRPRASSRPRPRCAACVRAHERRSVGRGSRRRTSNGVRCSRSARGRAGDLHRLTLGRAITISIVWPRSRLALERPRIGTLRLPTRHRSTSAAASRRKRTSDRAGHDGRSLRSAVTPARRCSKSRSDSTKVKPWLW